MGFAPGGSFYGRTDACKSFPNDRLGCIIYGSYSGCTASLFGGGNCGGEVVSLLPHPVPEPVGEEGERG